MKSNFFEETSCWWSETKVGFKYQLKIIIINYLKKYLTFMEKEYVAPEELRSRFEARRTSIMPWYMTVSLTMSNCHSTITVALIFKLPSPLPQKSAKRQEESIFLMYNSIPGTQAQQCNWNLKYPNILNCQYQRCGS